MAHGTEIKDLLDQKGTAVARGQSVSKNIINTNPNSVPDFKKQASVLRPPSGGVEDKISARFRESPEFFQREDVAKPSAQLIKEAKEKTDVGAVGVKPITKQRAKEVAKAKGAFRGLDPTKGESFSVSRKVGVKGKGGRTGQLITPGFARERGKFVKKSATPGFGTGRGQGQPDVFSARGIQNLFGSAADLAKIFASKGFQERKAANIRAAAGLKGRRADTKAKTEQIKAESGLLKDLVESGADEGLIKLVQDRLRERFETTARSANEDQLLGIDRELNRG